MSAEISHDGILSSLEGARDWGNLVYDGGTIGSGPAVPGTALPLAELTLEEYTADVATRRQPGAEATPSRESLP